MQEDKSLKERSKLMMIMINIYISLVIVVTLGLSSPSQACFCPGRRSTGAASPCDRRCVCAALALPCSTKGLDHTPPSSGHATT